MANDRPEMTDSAFNASLGRPGPVPEQTLAAFSRQNRHAFALQVVSLLQSESLYAERFLPEVFDADHARTNWQTVAAIEDIDTLRKTLSDTLDLRAPEGERGTFKNNIEFGRNLEQKARSRDAVNAEVATLILGDLLEHFAAYLEGPGAEQTIEWLLFLDRYCGDEGGLEAVGTLLRGLAAYATDATEAHDNFARAAQMVREQSVPDALHAATAFAVAHELSGTPDGGALKALDDAREAIAARPGLARFSADLRVWIEARERSVAALVEAETPPENALRDAITLDPYRPIYSRAVSAAANERAEEAVKLCSILDTVAARHGSVPNSAKALGEVAVMHNAWATGEALLHSAQEQGAMDGRARVLLARAIAQQGRTGEAIALLREVVDDEPENAEAWSDLGARLLEIEAHEPAREALLLALKLNPDDQIARMMLGTIPKPLAWMDRESGKLNLDPDLFELDAETQAVIITAAMIRSMPGDLEENLQEYAGEKGPAFVDRVRDAIMGKSRSTEERAVDRAARLFRSRRYTEAKDAYRAAIEDDPDNSYCYLGLGDCHYMLGELGLAAAYFEESIAVEPTTSAWRFLGDAYRKSGRRPQARAAYESAIELDPDYRLARQQLQAMIEEDAAR